MKNLEKKKKIIPPSIAQKQSPFLYSPFMYTCICVIDISSHWVSMVYCFIVCFLDSMLYDEISVYPTEKSLRTWSVKADMNGSKNLNTICDSSDAENALARQS